MTYSTPEIAAAARTTLRTVRWWEAKGLFGEVPRDKRGDRLFSEAHMQRAKVIAAASMAGMGLDEIAKASGPTLVSAIGGARDYLKSVYFSMDKDFDL